MAQQENAHKSGTTTVRESVQYLGVIPARAGSKRIPGKNMVSLCGKPLLQYTIDAALGSRRLGEVLITTDSVEVEAYGIRAGLHSPGLRPPELATDDARSVDVLQYVVRAYQIQRGTADAIVWLQPTSPFRTSEHIDATIELFEREQADTVIAVHTVHDHPYWCWAPAGRYLKPYVSEQATATERTSLPVVYAADGAICIVKWDIAAEGQFFGRRVVPYLMSGADCLDIDTPEDLAFARFLLSTAGASGSADAVLHFPVDRRADRDD